MAEYIDKEQLVDWLERVCGCCADGTVEAPTLYKQMITDIKNFGGVKADIFLPLQKKELSHLINDTIAYLWKMEDTGRTEDRFGYSERKECLEKMKKIMELFEVYEMPTCKKESAE
jgi:hypothetical protein